MATLPSRFHHPNRTARWVVWVCVLCVPFWSSFPRPRVAKSQSDAVVTIAVDATLRASLGTDGIAATGGARERRAGLKPFLVYALLGVMKGSHHTKRPK